MIPYGRQCVDEDDIQAVVSALRSDWLTTGPEVDAFEREFAGFVGAEHAVAVSSGTAALHAAMFALGIGPGDEIIVPAITFAASANCVVFQGGTPVFADVDPDTLLIDPASVESRITTRTRAIIAVDYAGQPCDYVRLNEIAGRYGLALVADACHSLGASSRGRAVGTLAALTAFSFHPVKHITTGEGGMITTSRADLAQRMRLFRNHGITTDHRQRQQTGSWRYEMIELGFNYRISDIQCALGRSQLKKLPEWLRRRRQIAERYEAAFASSGCVQPLVVAADVQHAWHLYVVRLDQNCPRCDRDSVFHLLRWAGVGANVHYSPVHLHPFYQKRYGYGPGLCPTAERVAGSILSLPMFATLSDDNVERVIETLLGAVAENSHDCGNCAKA